ncbi:GNAT family N-acetyltransferase [Gammaproteobacteria bacterium]|jgi:N-acetylglutamate synthase-like GNAT family acetyltransferase|nr:GNAT family N-acetyltransferase [Gammaproteobacteria bacterium]|tara:strand:+ start:6 stop:491 length:486 start_codon:yes stop_codon:yes gene_type:complete
MNGEYEIDTLEIVPYKDKYKLDFERLNREWIEEFFEMEDEDFNTLQHPESYVIAKSGEIFFAVLGKEVIGTTAMIPTSDRVFELAKMAVKKDFQGMGVGKILLKKCISFAREKKALEIFLLTNDVLKPALNLYLSCGFVLSDQYDDERYERGNTKMNLMLL